MNGGGEVRGAERYLLSEKKSLRVLTKLIVAEGQTAEKLFTRKIDKINKRQIEPKIGYAMDN
jgi:hypothetical protein